MPQIHWVPMSRVMILLVLQSLLLCSPSDARKGSPFPSSTSNNPPSGNLLLSPPTSPVNHLVEVTDKEFEFPPLKVTRNLLSKKCGLIGFDVWGCITDTFMSSADGWFSQQMGNPAMKGLMTDMIKKCSSVYLQDMVGSTVGNTITKLLGDQMPKVDPYDKLVCNIMDAARKRDPKQVQILQMDKCVGPNEKKVDSECKQQILGGGSSLDFMKSIVSAAAGVGDTDNELVKKSMLTYKSCSSGGKPTTECVGRSLVVYTCEGVCQTSRCQMDKYRTRGNDECQKSLDTNCEAGFKATNQLCQETAKSMISKEFSPPECQPKCEPSDASLPLQSRIPLAVLSLIPFFLR